MSIATPARKSKKKSTRERAEVARRWSHRQGPFLSAANAASLSLAVGTVGSLPEVGLPWWAPAAVGAIGATAAFTKAATARLPLLPRLYRPGRWAGFAGWSSLALATGTAWSPEMLAALGIGAAASALLRPASTSWEIAAQDRAEAEAEQAARLDLAVAWERRVDKALHATGTVVTDIREWEHPDPRDPSRTWKTGYTVKGKLPPTVGLGALKRVSGALADAADLPSGCGVEVAGLPESRRGFELFVSTVDALAETLPYPQDYSRLSINQPLPSGVYRDGTAMEIDLRWASALLIGATGSGKSSQLAALMASLLRCDDVIIWGIDPNGGGVFLPYLRPWLERRVDRPAIDWVATRPAEMHKMLDFALDAIPARKIGYADLMAASDQDKVPVSSAIPQIVIVADETASLSNELKAKLTDLNDRSRAASIRSVICSLRAVSDSVPKALIAQMQIRMGLRVNDETELNHLFGWRGKLPAPEEMPAEGYGLVRHGGGDVPRVFRGLYANPSKGAEAAEATASWRPELDDVTVRVNPGLYMDRWERARKDGWLPGGGVSAPGRPKSRPAAPADPAPKKTSGSTSPAGGLSGFGDAMSDLAESVRRTREEIEDGKNTSPASNETGDDVFRAMTEGLKVDPVSAGLPLVLSTALELSDGESAKGVSVAALSEALRWSRPTVRARMKSIRVEEDPKTQRWVPGAASERGYWRAALEVARDRILAGEIQVPPGIDAPDRPQ
ncbi:FtsK/SpoIIIE domain-containing protein [Nocardiopsis sp. NPDC057823]|uniref:FtsK/SpoIIIE domain-containing protein n=1 Tax=Nocardiopsis sp. NPDC057823 TaxID=3346256 RepID=UPI00366C3EF8